MTAAEAGDGAPMAVLVTRYAGADAATAVDRARAEQLTGQCLDLVARRVETRHGRVVEEGEGHVVALFENRYAAVLAAAEIQHEVATLNTPLPEEQELDVRIGIGLGKVVEPAGEGRALGTGVALATKLVDFAEPGGICLSNALYQDVGRRVPFQFRAVKLPGGDPASPAAKIWRLSTRQAVFPTRPARALIPHRIAWLILAIVAVAFTILALLSDGDAP